MVREQKGPLGTNGIRQYVTVVAPTVIENIPSGMASFLTHDTVT